MGQYRSFPFNGFGKGLNLQAKPDAVDPAECIDALNVLFTETGAIIPRFGYGKLGEVKLTNRVASLSPYYTTAGTKQLLAGCGTRLEGLSSAGAVVDSETGLTDAPWDFARFGKPNEEVVYAGNGTDTLRKWNGVEWTAPKATVDGVGEKAMPKAGSLCAWPGGDNRLVAARFETGTGGPGGNVSSPDHVYFSDAGDPTNWESTAYVQLLPGNGEKIMAIVTWRELVFVFKETSFAVFYGTSSDSEGFPVFNFRSIEAGVGLVAPRAVCVHPTGVYFLARTGVYRTTGQEPTLVSEALEPLFGGAPSAFYTGGTISPAHIEGCAMETYEERVLLSFPTGEANDRVLVYDPGSQWWSLLALPMSCMTVFRPSNRDELLFGYASGDKRIGRYGEAYEDDDGAAIAAHWRSGWFDLGDADIKKIRASKAWGTGAARMAIAHDFLQSPGTESQLDFGDPEAPKWSGSKWGATTWAEARGLSVDQRRVAARGTTFSTYFASQEVFSIHRLEHLVPAVEDPAKETA